MRQQYETLWQCHRMLASRQLYLHVWQDGQAFLSLHQVQQQHRDSCISREEAGSCQQPIQFALAVTLRCGRSQNLLYLLKEGNDAVLVHCKVKIAGYKKQHIVCACFLCQLRLRNDISCTLSRAAQSNGDIRSPNLGGDTARHCDQLDLFILGQCHSLTVGTCDDN